MPRHSGLADWRIGGLADWRMRIGALAQRDWRSVLAQTIEANR